MDVVELIEKYYEPDSRAYYFLLHHSRLVTAKALKIAERLADLRPDKIFIAEAAMLHDIGIYLTHAPKIGCFGFDSYVAHGVLGREILEREGLPGHAMVCERHVGTGITPEDVEKNNLPLPKRDMTPRTLEEKIICFADKFYTKKEHDLLHEKPVAEIRNMIGRYGEDKLSQFNEWMKFFREPG
jgi:uncharacterized protein